MPRKRLPPRLYWDKPRRQWLIRDGSTRIRLGLGDSERDTQAAHQRLVEYTAGKALDEIRGPRRSEDITVGEVLGHYLKGHGHQVKARERLIYAVQALSPFWADLRLDQVNGPAARRYIKTRDVSLSTVGRELSTLNAALRWCHREGIVSTLKVVPVPKGNPPREDWFTRSEIAEVLWQLRSKRQRHVARAVLIWFYTGTRMTAGLRLRWIPAMDSGWVDLDRRTLHRRGAAEVETKKRRGSCRIPFRLWSLMRTWRHGDLRRQELEGISAEWVCAYRGNPVASVKTALRAAVARANKKRQARGLPPLDGFTPHRMKHTAVTHAFQRGMTIEEAVDYFSTSRDTLERVYRHHSPNFQIRAADIMNRRD